MKEKELFDNSNLLKVIWKYKIHITIVVLATAILAAIFSGPAFITPMYKSTTTIYPANLAEYSEETSTEQMLQILRSNEIKNRIIISFNLYEHYGIDPNGNERLAQMDKYLGGNISFKRTQFESVEISVQDANPQLASDMADSIVKFYDEHVRMLHKKKWKEVETIQYVQMKRLENQMDSVKNILNSIGNKYGIVSPDYQAKEATLGLAMQNNGSNNKAEKILANLGNAAAEYTINSERLSYLNELHFIAMEQYEGSISELNKFITYHIMVSKPYPADKKSTPVRWVIVFFAVVAAKVFSILVAFLLEQIKSQKTKIHGNIIE